MSIERCIEEDEFNQVSNELKVFMKSKLNGILRFYAKRMLKLETIAFSHTHSFDAATQKGQQCQQTHLKISC